MRLVKLEEVPNQPMGEGTPIPGWPGGTVARSKQVVLPEGSSEDYSCSLFHFDPGATTGWHSHSCDQILVITAGTGIIATEQGEAEMNAGDVVIIEAGERHWHGATENTSMSHLAITTVGSSSFT